MKKKIYIAGAMTGIKDFNFPAFDEAAERWNGSFNSFTGVQWESVSPADMDRDMGIEPDENGDIQDFDYVAAMRRCCDAVCDCDAIYMLEGWENSKGARAEHALANALGLEMHYG